MLQERECTHVTSRDHTKHQAIAYICLESLPERALHYFEHQVHLLLFNKWYLVQEDFLHHIP